MAKKDKAPEQNSAPAVTSDTDITTEGQPIEQPEAAAAVIDFPQQEWEKPLDEIKAEQQPKRRGRPPKEDKATSGQVRGVDKVQ